MNESLIQIFIPTFHRPDSLERAAKNAHENTLNLHDVIFVSEPEDSATIDKVNELNEKLLISKHPGNHTGAANTCYEEGKAPFFIIANDDFNFHMGWDEPVMALFEENPEIGVVGVDDGSHQGFTTITVVRRAYIDKYSGCMDVPGVLYFPGYNHNYVDTEFSATAMKRGMFAACPASMVEHMHWAFGKNKMDATYEKSNATAPADAITFGNRQHLWR